MSDIVTLAHGSGGRLTHELIQGIFMKHFHNEPLLQGDDCARLEIPGGRMAFTTDSFVVSPIFFRGGDIGKLAVCGTVNDLVSAGAKPLYLSCGFILEEGFSLSELERIAQSMGETARACNVKLVTGDTKVVGRGAADKIFINTSGIGVIPKGIEISGSNAKPGDQVIVTGTLGDHGCSILIEREQLQINSTIESDCAPLNGMLQGLVGSSCDIHVLRDPTRGGLASTLNEIAQQSNIGIRLFENQIPIKNEVRGVCELLGLDPLYMANEGKMVVIVPPDEGDRVLDTLRQHPYGSSACVIGEVIEVPKERVIMETVTGGNRVVDMLVGDQLPRIC